MTKYDKCLKCGYYVKKGKQYCDSCMPKEKKEILVWHPNPTNHCKIPIEEGITWLMNHRKISRKTALMFLQPDKFKNYDRCAGNASEPKGIIKTMINEFGTYIT